jgi:hypothetical protein
VMNPPALDFAQVGCTPIPQLQLHMTLSPAISTEWISAYLYVG